jgi:hypothetical protein
LSVSVHLLDGDLGDPLDVGIVVPGADAEVLAADTREAEPAVEVRPRPAARPEEASPLAWTQMPACQRSASAGHVRELSFSDTPQGIVYWKTIYIQLGLDALPGRPADDGLAGLMPTVFEHVDALGIYTFDADRRAGQLRPLRAA